LLPPGLTPTNPSLPGIVRAGWWTAVYAAARGQLQFTAVLPAAAASRLPEIRAGMVLRSLPGGSGASNIPRWLGQERTVWRASSLHVVPIVWSADALAGQPPLR
jgi:hypothetical protein